MNYYRFSIKEYKFTVMETDGMITSLSFEEGMTGGAENRKTAVLSETERQLTEYFEGKRRIFELPLNPKGTPFQKKVWSALQTIPYGETKTYQDIAVQIGNEKACRAVGMANNKNPIAIVVPCHRVIGKNGKLVGYAGGLEKKEFLLELESE